MRKSSFFKVTAIFACLSFLLLTVPNVNAIEKKPKLNFKQIIKTPAMIIAFFFSPIFDTGKSTTPTNKDTAGKKIKITGTLSSPRVANGD